MPGEAIQSKARRTYLAEVMCYAKDGLSSGLFNLRVMGYKVLPGAQKAYTTEKKCADEKYVHSCPNGCKNSSKGN